MNIHEYQAKAVLREFGVPVSRGKVAFTPEEAEAAAKELGGPLFVVKGQIHAGGRGKGTFKSGFQGGVKVAGSVDEAVALPGFSCAAPVPSPFQRASVASSIRVKSDSRGSKFTATSSVLPPPTTS